MIKTTIFCLLLVVGAFGEFYDGRIVNGTNANPGEFPFIVSLRSATGSHSCGGSIISSQWILTAAHCAQRAASTITIQYGRLDISQKVDDSVVSVSQVIAHENYSSSTIENDVALLKLAKPINFTSTVQPAKLPKQNQSTPGGSTAILAGWGRNATSGPVQTTLQKVTLSVVSYDDCKRIHYNTVFPTNICAGVPGGYKGQCSGDSGGPLNVNDEVVGLVSWSVKPCTVPPYPGVYTRVASFRDWIKKNSGV